MKALTYIEKGRFEVADEGQQKGIYAAFWRISEQHISADGNDSKER